MKSSNQFIVFVFGNFISTSDKNTTPKGNKNEKRKKEVVTEDTAKEQKKNDEL